MHLSHGCLSTPDIVGNCSTKEISKLWRWDNQSEQKAV